MLYYNMDDDSNSANRISRMKLRAGINEKYEHWTPETQKKIKNYMKELKASSDTRNLKWHRFCKSSISQVIPVPLSIFSN